MVTGVLCRSIRDIARYYDVTCGYDARDPYSLPRHDRWEAELGTFRDSLRGGKVAISPGLGRAVVNPAVADRVVEAAGQLAADAGLEVVDVEVAAPELGFEWAMGNPGLAASRPRGPLAGMRGRPHRGDRLRRAPRRGQLQPRHGGPCRGRPHPGQRGDGGGARRGGLR